MLRLSDVDAVSIEPTVDTELTPWSHSMLNAISTCPTQGLVTYAANRVMSAGGRAMALEAGSAAHETYAAARLWQVGMVQGLTEHMQVHGERLFGADKLLSMFDASNEAGDDKRNAMLRFCLEAFYTSGFYDDPSDRRRTFTNIEEALIAYLDRFDFRRDVWVEDRNNPHARVGIEIPIDITCTYQISKDTAYDDRLVLDDSNALRIRFVGTADGVTVRDNTLRLEENKTASRLGEAWSQSFHTSHQVTGYLMGLSVTLHQHITHAAIHGMCIPLPRSYDAGGLMTEPVSRTPQQYSDFLEWLLHSTQIINIYGGDPLLAPKYTGACNKYFRPCSLIPLCASDIDDRREYFDMMVERPPSPTEKAMEGDD